MKKSQFITLRIAIIDTISETGAAIAQGCQRIDWQTDTGNAVAVHFYKSLAACHAAQVSFRLE